MIIPDVPRGTGGTKSKKVTYTETKIHFRHESGTMAAARHTSTVLVL